jgi:copper resistance protein C
VSAWAHAFLDHAGPRVGDQVRAAPSKVKIWFTERVKPALSRIEVFDSAGKEVDRHDSQVNSTNPAILEVSRAPVKPGKYKASWRVTAVDTHVTTTKPVSSFSSRNMPVAGVESSEFSARHGSSSRMLLEPCLNWRTKTISNDSVKTTAFTQTRHSNTR